MTKHVVFCSSAFLIFLFITPGFADEHFPFLAIVSKESVNVRAGPNTNFEKVDKLSKDAKVIVLGRSYEWYKVQPLPTTREYIRSDYLKMQEGSLTVAVIIGNNVNVRAKPNSEAASLGELKEGTLVNIVGKADGWSELQPVAGTAAWIHQDFLKEVSSEVPASMLITALQPSGPVVQVVTRRITQEPVKKVVIEHVTLQGALQPLVQAPEEDVHYKIVIDDKTAFYLKDIPQLSNFTNQVVNVEGTVIPDPQKKFIHPLLLIKKITLVL